jgi:hypothetical protein
LANPVWNGASTRHHFHVNGTPDTAPSDFVSTACDEQHLITYLRLLDGNAVKLGPISQVPDANHMADVSS